MQVICVYHSNFLQNIKNTRKQKKLNKLELVAKEINRNVKLKKLTVFVLANLLYCEKALANTEVSVTKINQAGNTILGICRTIGYWSCILMCISNIIKELLQGETKSIAKIIIKYALAFSSFYLLPWILDIIKDIFA